MHFARYAAYKHALDHMCAENDAHNYLFVCCMHCVIDKWEEQNLGKVQSTSFILQKERIFSDERLYITSGIYSVSFSPKVSCGGLIYCDCW